MRRALILFSAVAVIALVGAGALRAFGPCALSRAALGKLGSDAGSCAAPAVVAAEQPREVEPPAVTVVQATQREFVDRLFVSGTLGCA